MVLYGTMNICMETMGEWNAMILYRKVWNLLSSVWKSIFFLYTIMKTMCVWKSSFGLESLNTWFGTLYFVYGLGLETPKLISC